MTFSGVTMAGLGITVMQTAPWTGQLTSLLSADGLNGTGVLLRLIVPTDGWRFIGGLLGDLYVGGAFSALVTIGSTPLGTQVRIASFTFTNAGLQVLALRVTRVTRAPIGIAVGNAIGVTATTLLAPTITLAPV
jgi:hypothetical protein